MASVFTLGLYVYKFQPLPTVQMHAFLCTVASALVAISLHKQSYVSRVFGCYNCVTIFYNANSVLE